MSTEIVTRTVARRALPARGAFERQHLALAVLLAAAAGLSGAWISHLRRLHGSRQLGHRHRRRLAVRLHAAVRHHALEPDGDSAAEPFAQAGRGHGARPGAALPRELRAAGSALRSGCWPRSPSPPATWPRSSVRPSRSSCSSTFRCFTACSSPASTCC